jgi:hypothetical protein
MRTYFAFSYRYDLTALAAWASVIEARFVTGRWLRAEPAAAFEDFEFESTFEALMPALRPLLLTMGTPSTHPNNSVDAREGRLGQVCSGAESGGPGVATTGTLGVH